MSDGGGLPTGWATTTVGEVAQSVKNGIYKAKEFYAEHGTPCLRMYNIDDGRLVWQDLKRMTLTDEEQCEYGLVSGDIVVNRVNSRELVGKACVIPEGLGIAVFESKNIRLRICEGACVSAYLNYWFLLEGRRYFSANAQQTVGMASINQEQLTAFPFPLPPLPEQQRIVAKIEELFSDLDAGVQNLERAKANLKRYRASVLRAAVEGRLTEEWRAANPQEENGQMLLDRILRERREKWEQDQLAKFRQKGKEPPKNWQSKYEEPAEPDVSELQELPEGWVWATVGQMAESVRYGSSAKTSADTDGVPVLRMGNISNGTLDLADLKYLAVDHQEFPELLLQNGDLLFNRTNSPELVGKSAVYRGIPTPCSYASYLIAVRALSGLQTDLLTYFLNSVFGRVWVKRVVVQQVGQANVNGTKLQALSIPLPPLAEQHQIVALVEERLSQIDAAEKTIDAELLRAKRLRQSILKQAFEGKLVPQDPNDEPASVPLERIKAARAAEPPTKRTKRSKKATAK